MASDLHRPIRYQDIERQLDKVEKSLLTFEPEITDPHESIRALLESTSGLVEVCRELLHWQRRHLNGGQYDHPELVR